MEEILKKVEELTASYEASKKTLIDALKPGFTHLFSDIFARHPTLLSFSWRQYTPYYNDGDSTSFSVNNDSESIEVISSENPSEVLYGYELDEQDPFAKAVEEISSILQRIPDDIYLDMFEDHMSVMVHRDGKLTVSECSHD